MFINHWNMVIHGQNSLTAGSKYALARLCLLGDELAAFNETATEDETNEQFQVCFQGLISHVFPRHAISVQKRYKDLCINQGQRLYEIL